MIDAMSQTLRNQLRQIRRRVRLAVGLRGLSWVVVLVFGSALAVGFLDWLIQWNDGGVRLLLSASFAGLAVWGCWRFLIRGLFFQLTDVELAHRIEDRYPQFQDRLSSTVQFVEGGCRPEVGSPDLQQHVIDETLQSIERVDLADIVELRGVLRIASAAVVVCLATAIVTTFNQPAAATAVNRLVFPWSERAWPKRTALQLLDTDFVPLELDAGEPIRLAFGDGREYLVENRKGALPETVLLQSLSEGEPHTRSLARRRIRDESGRTREFAVVELAGRRNERFRVVGGDDDSMPWYSVEVIPPPLVDSLHVTLDPPDYLQQSSQELLRGVGHIEGVVGTRVGVEAHFNKPVQSAELRIKGRSGTPLDVSSDGTTIATAFEISEAGTSSYWFVLHDRDGFANVEAPRYEIRGLPDRIPDVYLERPATDLRATPKAAIGLRIVARDDFGLSSLSLRFRINESEEETVVDLELPVDESPVTETVATPVWKLAELGLRPGMRLAFHASGTDAFDLGGEHVGHSATRIISIVSEMDKIEELTSRQIDVLEDLERVRRVQNPARKQTTELKLQIATVGRLRPEDVDSLNRVEMQQRQVQSRLFNPIDGTLSLLWNMRDEVTSNQLDAPALTRRLDDLTQTLSDLRDDVLPPLQQDLTRAVKQAQTGSSRAVADALELVGEHQQTVTDVLDAMQHTFTRWKRHSDLSEELERLARGQKEIHEQTLAPPPGTLGRPFERLKPQEQADLVKLGKRQRSLADELDRFRNQLRDDADSADPQTQFAKDRFREAGAELDRRSTSERLRESASRLRRNATGEAAELQSEALKDLETVDQLLRDQADESLEMLVKKLQREEARLDDLGARQQEMLHKQREAARTADALARLERLKKLAEPQKQLAKNAHDALRRLRRMQMREATSSVDRAAQRMRDAANALTDGESHLSGEQMQEALDDLLQARRELATARGRAQEKLAHELVERIGGTLEGLAARQENVVEEATRLDRAFRERGSWSRVLLRTLKGVVDEQSRLREETDELIQPLQAQPVYALALRGASRSMQRGLSGLRARDVGEEPIRHLRAAADRFRDLARAFNPKSAPSGTETPASPVDDANSTDAVPQIAQLEMIRIVQHAINERTAQLAERRQSGRELNAAEQQELADLAQEQGQLLELTRRISETLFGPAAATPHGKEQQP